MRQIKFKAKRLGNGEWVEGLPIIYKVDGSYMWRECREPVRIDPNTLCQFTGLKDCEGKEVWEHDITLDAGDEMEVIFYDGSFMLHDVKDRNNDEDIPLCRCGEKGMIINRVVGNKFDKGEKK